MRGRVVLILSTPFSEMTRQPIQVRVRRFKNRLVLIPSPKQPHPLLNSNPPQLTEQPLVRMAQQSRVIEKIAWIQVKFGVSQSLSNNLHLYWSLLLLNFVEKGFLWSFFNLCLGIDGRSRGIMYIFGRFQVSFNFSFLIAFGKAFEDIRERVLFDDSS